MILPDQLIVHLAHPVIPCNVEGKRKLGEIDECPLIDVLAVPVHLVRAQTGHGGLN